MGAKVRRYLTLYKAFLRSSFVREAEFRANFWAKVAFNFIWLGFFLLTLKIIYRHTNAVAGWSESEALLLAATCYLLDALIGTFFYFGLVELPTMVRQGTLDFVLFKPIDSQFWISLRRINLDKLGDLFGALALSVYAFLRLGYVPEWIHILLYFGMVVCGVTIYYSFHFMMMTLGIWLVRVENLWVLSDVFVQVARFPTDIFDQILRRLFTYILPIAFLATIPTKTLLGKLEPGFILFATFWALGFFLFSRFFWRFALKSYASASS